MHHFPMYIDDFRAGTLRLTNEEVGAYIRLLLEIYDQGGSISSDPHELAFVLRVHDVRVVKRLLRRLLECGKIAVNGALLTNSKANAVIAAVHKKTEQTSSAVKKRWNINGHAHTNVDTFVDANVDPAAILSKAKAKEEERKNAREARWPFDEFWEAYPHKVGKGAAEKAFRRVEKSEEVYFSVLMAALLTYRSKTDDRPWCNPATWLNQKRWLDRPAAGKREGWRGAIL